MSPAATLRENRREEETADPEAVLTALNDDDCRAILAAVSDGAETAKELAEDCDLPLSTAYRKLELLTDAALVEEQTRIGTGNRHPSQYERDFDGVHVDVSEDGTLDIEPVSSAEEATEDTRDPPARERLVTSNAD